MKNNYYLLTKFIVYFTFGIMFFLFSFSKVSASNVLSPVYSTSPPASYSLAPEDEQYICGSWTSTCWNSWVSGATNCGAACTAGNTWTKYTYSGCYYDLFNIDNYLPVYLSSTDLVCSTGDKYNSGNPPVMSAGNCECNVGGGYKTCCSGTTPVGARHGDINNCPFPPLCDPYPPDEADCGEYTELRCGDDVGVACGQPTCNTLAPTSTPTPTPTDTPEPTATDIPVPTVGPGTPIPTVPTATPISVTPTPIRGTVTIQGRHVDCNGNDFTPGGQGVMVDSPPINTGAPTWYFNNLTPRSTPYNVTASSPSSDSYNISYNLCTNCATHPTPPTDSNYTAGRGLQVTLPTAGNYADIYFRYCPIPTPTPMTGAPVLSGSQVCIPINGSPYVNLVWSNILNNTGYQLNRYTGATSCNTTPIRFNMGKDSTTYQDGPLLFNTNYSYSVIPKFGKDSNGQDIFGEASNCYSFRTPPNCGSNPVISITPTVPITSPPPRTPTPSSRPSPTVPWSSCFLNYTNISVYAFSDPAYDENKWPYYTWTASNCGGGGDSDYLPPSMQNTLLASFYSELAESIEKLRDDITKFVEKKMLSLFKPKSPPLAPLAKPKLLAQAAIPCTPRNQDTTCATSNPCVSSYSCSYDGDSCPNSSVRDWRDCSGTCTYLYQPWGTTCGTNPYDSAGKKYCTGTYSRTCLDPGPGSLCKNPSDCDDGNLCTNDLCEIGDGDTLGYCRYTNQPQGTPCQTDASRITTKVCDASGGCSIDWTNCTDLSQQPNDSSKPNYNANCCGTTNIQFSCGTCSTAPYPFPPSSTAGTISKQGVLVYAEPNTRACPGIDRVEATTGPDGKADLLVASAYSDAYTRTAYNAISYKISASSSTGENFTRGTHYKYKNLGGFYPIYLFKNVNIISAASYGSVATEYEDATRGWANYLSFGFAPRILPWFQGVGGDIRIDKGISNPVLTTTYASLEGNGTPKTPGVIFSGASSFDFCQNGLGPGCQERSSIKRWVAGGPTYPEVFSPVRSGLMRTSYDYYTGVARQSGIDPIDLSSKCNLSGCSLPPQQSNFPNGLYKADGNLTLNAYSFPQNNDYVILVSGDLLIKGDLDVPNESTVTFSVKGDIIVDKNVGPNSVSTPNPNLEGFYSTDKSFIVDGNNDCTISADKRLNMEGVVVVNAALSGGTFQNKRDLCQDNSTKPSFYIVERPDMILNAPEFLKHPNFVWQEVAP